MEDKIYINLFNLEFSVFVISFCISLLILRAKTKPDYMNWFVIYTSFALINIFFDFFVINNLFPELKQLGIIIYNLSLIFHFTFLSLFVLRVIKPTKNRNIYYLIILIINGLIIYQFILNNLYKRNLIALIIVNFGLIIYSFIYYISLFRDMPKEELKETPAFWIITGFFFCVFASLPYLFLARFSGNLDINTLKLLHYLNSFCYIIMHLLFIKGFICTIQQHRRG